MLNLIVDRPDIEKSHQEFINILEKYCNIPILVKLGFQHTHIETTINWSRETALWFYSEKRETRYWDLFGFSNDQPKELSYVTIVVEINPPTEGLNKRVQGAIARDDNGNIWILHRGKINITGLKNVNIRSAFFENFNGKTVDIGDDKFAVVGNINSPDFIYDLIKFVYEVKRIKSLLKYSV
jgi:hypothetical protein